MLGRWSTILHVLFSCLLARREQGDGEPLCGNGRRPRSDEIETVERDSIMSDCSTRAFAAHEKPEISDKQISGAPKTCGTCGISDAAIRIVKCPYRKWLGQKMCDWKGHPRYEHGYDETACENYISNPDSLELRCQKLEQVAVAMQQCLATHAHDWTQVSDYTAAYYRNQLEALGVSVDD